MNKVVNDHIGNSGKIAGGSEYCATFLDVAFVFYQQKILTEIELEHRCDVLMLQAFRN
jgi:hypothetical protein